MSNELYRIYYSQIDDISFSNASSMRKHLTSESKLWDKPLTEIFDSGNLDNVLVNSGQSVRQLHTPFSAFIEALDTPSNFNRLTNYQHNRRLIPPPSTSLAGQLILGLLANGAVKEASVTLASFWVKNAQTYRNSAQSNHLIELGNSLLLAAHAAAALPFRTVSSQQIAATAKSAKMQLRTLDEEVRKAEQINTNHEENLHAMRDKLVRRASRLKKFFINSERKRRDENANKFVQIDEEVNNRFNKAERRLEALDKRNRDLQNKRQQQFDKLLDLFHAQLRLKAPVKLWEDRSRQHKIRSTISFSIFISLTVLAICIGAAVPYLFGDYIANSFFVRVCDDFNPDFCVREFSAKGPLTISGILVIMSLVLWSIRLQYRVFLSERHLSLDASEKKAFAETYLAMKDGEDVDKSNEAIVLASLFRPTQDGIIKDDEATIDLSAASILARQLGRST